MPAARTLPCVLDIEASGFGRRSYPIEVGYVLPDGRARCMLVRPGERWTHWEAGGGPAFRLESVHALLGEDALARLDATRRTALAALGLNRHRASNDARALQRALAELGAAG